MTKKKEDEISLLNWRITENIPLLEYEGFKATLEATDDTLFSKSKLNKEFKKYLEKPAFKK